MRLGSVAVAALSLSATPAWASTSHPGKATDLIVNHDGRFFFNHSGTRTAMPPCSGYQRWVIDATTPAGQAMMSLVMTASAQGRSMYVFGTGGCGDWPDTEAIAHIQVVN